MKALETAEITMLRKITRNRMNDNPQWTHQSTM
jgi:hypothetical protein